MELNTIFILFLKEIRSYRITISLSKPK